MFPCFYCLLLCSLYCISVLFGCFDYREGAPRLFFALCWLLLFACALACLFAFCSFACLLHRVLTVGAAAVAAFACFVCVVYVSD